MPDAAWIDDVKNLAPILSAILAPVGALIGWAIGRRRSDSEILRNEVATQRERIEIEKSGAESDAALLVGINNRINDLLIAQAKQIELKCKQIELLIDQNKAQSEQIKALNTRVAALEVRLSDFEKTK